MAEGWLRFLWCQASIILLRLKVKPDHEAHNVWDPVPKSFELQVKRFESVEVTYDVGPGKCFTPWIWKTSRAYRLMRRATFKCTARETAILRPRILTKVSSNSFNLEPTNLLKKSPKLSNLRECIPPTLRRDTQSHTGLLQSAETHGFG